MKIEKHVFTLNAIRQTKTGRFVYTDLRNNAYHGNERNTKDMFTAFRCGVFEEFAAYSGHTWKGSPEWFAAQHLMLNPTAVCLAQLGLTGKVSTGEELAERKTYDGKEVLVTVSPDGLTLTVEYLTPEVAAESLEVTRLTRNFVDMDDTFAWVDDNVEYDNKPAVRRFLDKCEACFTSVDGIPAQILDNFAELKAYAAAYGI